MTHAEFISAIAEKTGLKKADVVRLTGTVFETIKETLLSGDQFRIPEVGTLTIAERAPRAARTGRNPRTGEPLQIAAVPAKKTVTFKVKKEFKNELN